MSEQNKIDEIKEALAEATPGPWQARGLEIWHWGETEERQEYIAVIRHDGNRCLIAAAPEYITYLLAEIERKDKALKFYADKDNYNHPYVPAVVEDAGKRAREAL